MSINITLTPLEERKLADLARANGKDPAAYAHDVVSTYLKIVHDPETRTFEEIISPIWDAWRKSGLTNSEVDDLFEEELQATRSERRTGENAP
jgi:hypothetical protein